MKRKLITTTFLGLLYSSSIFAADPSATQTVTMTINSTSTITTSGNPSTLAVTLDDSGAGSATDNTTTYTVKSNTDAKGKLKIAGQITTGGDMPKDTELTLALTSTEGTSQGAQALDSKKPVDLVSDLPTLLSDTGSITYTFSVTDGWTIPTTTLDRTVTLTLVSSS